MEPQADHVLYELVCRLFASIEFLRDKTGDGRFIVNERRHLVELSYRATRAAWHADQLAAYISEKRDKSESNQKAGDGCAKGEGNL